MIVTKWLWLILLSTENGPVFPHLLRLASSYFESLVNGGRNTMEKYLAKHARD